jgi:anhydro-N-acetylmuramic acid kinase
MVGAPAPRRIPAAAALIRAPVQEYYIGLMSGTSLDGVDAVLVRIGDATTQVQVLGHVHRQFSTALRQTLLALNSTGENELHRAALASNAVSQAYGDAIRCLLSHCAVDAQAVHAVGAHGQTVRHQPGEFDGTGYTVQLLSGALLAELCGIDVVCDFRSRDVAAGGQGAPLVPAFHAAVFGQAGLDQAVLNLGGIGNVTLLGADGRTGGFDCGPGNVLLDLWCERQLGLPFDDNGRWAHSGQIDQQLLARLLAEPFLHQLPPKSTGRDLFNATWLDAILQGLPHARQLANADVQATLAELTACAATQAIQKYQPDSARLLVCGGGALNHHLMQRLAAHLPAVQVMSTEPAGMPPMQVEATAFAWLAHAFTQRRTSNCPAVTGARGPRILGALHPAR